MAVFLVEKMKKDKPICGKEATSPLLINDDQFYQWCYFNRSLMVSNNIIIVSLRPFSSHITAVYMEVCVKSQFSGICN